jgi:hypothetical protein
LADPQASNRSVPDLFVKYPLAFQSSKPTIQLVIKYITWLS